MRQRTIRLPDNIDKQIEALAEKDQRSANWIIIQLLTEALAHNPKEESWKHS